MTDELHAILKGAFEGAAGAYDGSEEGLNRLIAALMPFENYVRAQNGGMVSQSLEQAYAKAAGFDPKSTNDLVGEAAQNFYYRLLKANDFDTVLSMLERGGGYVIRDDKSLVLTDEGRIHSSINDEPEEFKGTIFQPRFAQLVEYLADKGIYADDMIVRVEKLDPAMMRKKPYVVISIPRIDKEIAVCDQLGQVTFVANEILSPETWAGYSKENLKSLSVINTAAYDSNVPANWLARIDGYLFGDDGAKPKPKIKDLPAAAKSVGKKAKPLSVAIILEILNACARTDERGKVLYPVHGDIFEDGLLKGERYMAINMAIRKRGRGLEGENIPSDVNSLSEFMIWQGLLKRKQDLTVAKIKETLVACARTDERGKVLYPVQGDVFEGGPLKGESYHAISMAIRQRQRGLEREGIPETIKTLPQFIKHYMVEGGIDAKPAPPPPMPSMP